MTIKDFQSKIRSENGVLFSALRKLNSIDDPARVIEMKSEMIGWNTWPTLEAATPASS